MDGARLKMNLSKTEFIYFANARQLQKYEITSINIAGNLIVISYLIWYLGVWLNPTLNFKTHITKNCQAAMLNFTKIRSIHHLLTQDATSSLVLSLCISHLNYCNSVLYALPNISLNRLQRVQNMCAHLVLKGHQETVLWSVWLNCIGYQWSNVLHSKSVCLPIHYYISKAHNTYRKCCNTACQQQASLIFRPRLTNNPHTKLKTFTCISFNVGAPTLWNDLPSVLRGSNSLLSFKHDLKSHLYREAFGTSVPMD